MQTPRETGVFPESGLSRKMQNLGDMSNILDYFRTT